MNKSTESICKEWQSELTRTQGPSAPKVEISDQMLVCQDHWYTQTRVMEMIERLKSKPDFAA